MLQVASWKLTAEREVRSSSAQNCQTEIFPVQWFCSLEDWGKTWTGRPYEPWLYGLPYKGNDMIIWKSVDDNSNILKSLIMGYMCIKAGPHCSDAEQIPTKTKIGCDICQSHGCTTFIAPVPQSRTTCTHWTDAREDELTSHDRQININTCLILSYDRTKVPATSHRLLYWPTLRR